MFKEIVRANRSYRRFDPTHKISTNDLLELIELARLCPSSRNQQALKFMLFNQEPDCAGIFSKLAWAGYLKDWDGPVSSEVPTAYVLVLGDINLGSSFEVDLGIVAQTILLGAVEKGLGGCMIASIKRKELSQDLSLPDHLKPILVIALGKPAEQVEIVPVVQHRIAYFRDENQVHYVPKRDLDALIYPH